MIIFASMRPEQFTRIGTAFGGYVILLTPARSAPAYEHHRQRNAIILGLKSLFRSVVDKGHLDHLMHLGIGHVHELCRAGGTCRDARATPLTQHGVTLGDPSRVQ